MKRKPRVPPGTTVPTASIGGMARMEIVKATKKIFGLLSR